MTPDKSEGTSLSMEVHVGREEMRAALEEEVRIGLSAPEKWLSPVWFYDEHGSRLFDEITRLPEYYLTRAERRLLEANGAEIARQAGCDTLLELGAGTCDKSCLLLDAMQETGSLKRFVPLDVSDATLWEAANKIVSGYPELEVRAVVADFLRHIDQVPSEGRRMIAFLGSTIGNLDPEQRRKFYFDLDCVMQHGDTLLLGTDLVKEPQRLLAAYDDPSGVTAAFNKNALCVLGSELGATFVPDLYDHVAVWDDTNNRIEMRLRARKPHSVDIEALDMTVELEDGEEIRTEISTKFTRTGVTEELLECGFVVQEMWEDPEGFLLTLAAPYC